MSDETATESITLTELINAHIGSRLSDLHVAIPAQVESYDTATQTVSVTPQLNRSLPDGNGNFNSETLPQLADIPVVFQRCKQFAMTFPLVQGDFGLLIICQRNIGTWRSVAQQSDAGDLGMHTLDGAVFLPGLYPDKFAAAKAHATNMVIGSENHDESRIEIKPSGGINLGAGATLGVARSGDDLSSSIALRAWAAAVDLALTNLAAAVGAVIPPMVAPAPQFAGGAGGTGGLGVIHSASVNIKAVD